MNKGPPVLVQWHPVLVSEAIDEEVLTETVRICAHVMPIRLMDTRSLEPFEVLAGNKLEQQTLADLIHQVIADQLARKKILSTAKRALAAEIEVIIAQATGRAG